MNHLFRCTLSAATLGLLASSCALLDGLKDGELCLFAGDDSVDPSRGPSAADSCERQDQDSFRGRTYFTSIIRGETRAIRLVAVEEKGSPSDDPVRFSIPSTSPALPAGVRVVLPSGPVPRHGTRSETTFELSATSSAALGAFAFLLEGEGVEGKSAIIVQVAVASGVEVAGLAGDDLLDAPGLPGIVVADCLEVDGTSYPRVVQVNRTTLVAERTIYSPPLHGEPNMGCVGSSCGPGSTVTLSCTGGGSGGCPGRGSCPQAVAVEAGPTSTPSLLVGVGTAIVRVDPTSGAATTVAKQLQGRPIRILHAADGRRLLVLAAKSTTEEVRSAASDVVVLRIDLDSPGTTEVLADGVASDMAKVTGDRIALLGRANIVAFDLDVPAPERKPDQVAAGFDTLGLRMVSFPEGGAVLSPGLARIDLTSGAVAPYRPLPGALQQNNGNSVSLAAFTFEQSPSTDVVADVGFMLQNTEGPQTHVGRLERLVAASTATVVGTIGSSNQGGGGYAVALTADGRTLFVVMGNAIRRFDTTTGAEGALINLPSSPGPGHNFARAFVAPDGARILLVDVDSPAIRSADLTTGAISDVYPGGCPADAAFDPEGNLLVLDPMQDSLLRLEGSPARPTIVAAQLGFGVSGCSTTTYDGSTQLMRYGLAVKGETAWISSEDGLRRVDLTSGKKTQPYAGPVGGRLGFGPNGHPFVLDAVGGLLELDPATGKRTRHTLGDTLLDCAFGPAGAAALCAAVAPGPSSTPRNVAVVRVTF